MDLFLPTPSCSGEKRTTINISKASMMPENQGAAAVVWRRRSAGGDCDAVVLGGQSVRRGHPLLGRKPVIREGRVCAG